MFELSKELFEHIYTITRCLAHVTNVSMLVWAPISPLYTSEWPFDQKFAIFLKRTFFGTPCRFSIPVNRCRFVEHVNEEFSFIDIDLFSMLKAWKLWNISLTLHWTGSNFTYFEWGGGQILATPFKLSLEGIFGVKWIGDPKSMQE